MISLLRSINPNFNSNFDGFYYFNLELRVHGFAVMIDNDNVIIFFDDNLVVIKFGVRHAQNGYVLFDSNMSFIGHLESDSYRGYNEFDMHNSWIRFVK